jgi:hypothetical protein
MADTFEERHNEAYAADAVVASDATIAPAEVGASSETKVIEEVAAEFHAVAPTDGWPAWSEKRRQLGQQSQHEYEGSRQTQRNAVGHLVIEISCGPSRDWKGDAYAHRIDVPKSRHAQMPAVVVTFGGTTSTETAKKALSAFLDRMAAAVGWLVTQVKKRPTDFPASELGVEAVLKLIDDNGGFSEIAKLQRIALKEIAVGGRRPAKIKLDPAAQKKSHVDRALDLLVKHAPSPGATMKLGFVYDDGASRSVGAVIEPDDDVIERALLDLKVVDQLVDQLGELLQAGEMVAEESSTALVNPLDDPEDPEEGYRKAFRHFVFEDDKPVVIAPILVSSSVIVRAAPIEPMFGRPLGKPCHFRTRERRIMETNIAEPARRGAFSAYVEDAGDTLGVFRIVVTTEVAAEKTDNGRNVGVLVEPLRSAQDNLPLAIDLDRFNVQIEGNVSHDLWKRRHKDYVAKSHKEDDTKTVQKHSFTTTEWTIRSAKKNDRCDFQGSGAATDVEVFPADFKRVSEVITSLPVIGEITVKAARHIGLVIAFSTEHFAYEVYIPARTTAGDRTAALLLPYSV